MKKIFILFPVFALLLAGCTLTKEPMTNNSGANQSDSALQEQVDNLNNQEQDLREGNNSTDQDGDDLMASNQTDTDRQIYNNNRYSYTIEYPADWYIDTTSSEADFSQRGPQADNEFIGGDTSFSNYQNLSSYNMENPAPADLYEVSLKIYKVDVNSSYDQFFASKNFGYDTKENIIINGLSAVQLTGVTVDSPTGVTVVNTFIKVGEKMFVFNYSGNPIPQPEEEAANRIINSFLVK